MVRLLAFVLAICAWVSSSAQDVTRESALPHINLEDLEKLRISTRPHVTVDLSPDGGTLATIINDRVAVIGVQDRKVIAEVGPGWLPRWAPDGNRLVFYSSRSGSVQLWLWDIRNRKIQQLTEFSGGIDPNPTTRVFGYVRDAFRVSWAPDSTRIAFASRVRDAAEYSRGSVAEALRESPSPARPQVLTTSTSVDWALAGVFTEASSVAGVVESRDGHTISFRPTGDSFGHIFVVDVRSRETKRLTVGEATTYFHPAWSPSGASIAYVAIDGRGVKLDTRETQIRVIDIGTETEQQITQGPGVKTFPLWSPKGDRLAYVRSEQTITRREIRVASLNSSSTRTQTVTLDRGLNEYQWATDSALLVTFRDGTSTPLGRIGIETGEVEEISERRGSALGVRGFSSSRNGAIAWGQIDPKRLWSVQYLRPGGRSAETILVSDALAGNPAFGNVSLEKWRNRSGEEKEGTLLLPPNASPAKKYPLIVDAYPLLSGDDWTSPLLGNYAWASAGYAVFRPSPRAPHTWMNDWKSEASSLIGKGPAGWDVAFDDIMSGVDALIERGIVDADRMCLHGFSNGGNVVIHMVSRTRRFRCAVAVAPASTNAVRQVLLRPNSAAFVGDPRSFERDISSYIAVSPVFHLAKVETPILLAVGDKDGDFLLNAVEIYVALRRLGREVTLVRYPNQGHHFTGEAMKDFWGREVSFFRQHIGPAVPN
jgi:dipeptidyl aminopeptidase/acylaminoacyl peptidase